MAAIWRKQKLKLSHISSLKISFPPLLKGKACRLHAHTHIHTCTKSRLQIPEVHQGFTPDLNRVLSLENADNLVIGFVIIFWWCIIVYSENLGIQDFLIQICKKWLLNPLPWRNGNTLYIYFIGAGKGTGIRVKFMYFLINYISDIPYSCFRINLF